MLVVQSRVVAVVAVMVATIQVTDRAFATDHHWNIGNGIWSQPVDWSPATVPGPTDNAIIDFFGNGTPGHSTISVNNLPAVPSVKIASGDSVSVGNNGSLLCGGDFVVGNSNSSGFLSVTNSNPINAYFGGLTVAANLQIGALSGAGTVTQNDGTVTVGNLINIAASVDPSSEFRPAGTYNLSGGHLRAQGMNIAAIPAPGAGTFNLSGGVVNLGTLSVYNSSSVHQTGGQMTITNFLEVNTGSTYTMDGGSLSVNNGGLFGQTDVWGGATLQFNGGNLYCGMLYSRAGGHVQLGSGGDKVLFVDSLSPVGTVDLNDNAMFMIGSQANYNEVKSDLHNAYHGGAWNVGGLTSSAAAIAAVFSTHKTALGYGYASPNPFFPLAVKYTYYGDANLDGQVDVTDLGALATNWQAAADWSGGDFNYDGFVDVTDLGALATNWQQGVGNPLGSMSLAAAMQSVGLGGTPMPEPVTTSTILLPSIAALLRRRRVENQ